MKQNLPRTEGLILKDALFWRIYLLTSAFIFICYAVGYLNTPALPTVGNPASGWWGWADQGGYYRAVTAWSHGDLAPNQHWYFPGYPLIGALFYGISKTHPYFLPDIILILGALYSYMRISRSFSVGPLVSAILFLLSSVMIRDIFQEYIVPWSTKPVVFIYMTIFAITVVSADYFETERTQARYLPSLMGALAGAVIFFRLSDLLPLVPLFITYFGVILYKANLRVAAHSLIWCIAGFVPTAGAAIAVYLKIYGFHESGYMKVSEDLGFNFSALLWKFNILFIDPRPIYPDGDGILWRMPWIFFGICGMVSCFLIKESWAKRSIAVVIFFYFCLYLSYTDLKPTGLWRFSNFHYFIWTFPLAALFGWMFLKGLVDKGRRYKYMAVAMVVLFATSWHAVIRTLPGDPLHIEAGRTISMNLPEPTAIAAIDLPITYPSQDQLTAFSNADYPMTVDGKALVNFIDFQTLRLTRDTIRLIMLHKVKGRQFQINFPPENTFPEKIAVREDRIGMVQTAHMVLGWPRWLPIVHNWHGNLRYDPKVPEWGPGLAINLGQQVNFGADEAGRDAMLEGWSGAEAWGTWTSGNMASLRFHLPESNAAFIVNINAQAFVMEPKVPQQVVEVYANHRKIGDWTFRSGTAENKQVTIPQGIIMSDGQLDLEFKFSTAARPSSVSESADQRMLALGLIGLNIQTAD